MFGAFGRDRGFGAGAGFGSVCLGGGRRLLATVFLGDVLFLLRPQFGGLHRVRMVGRPGVNTLIGASVSTGGPSTNLPFAGPRADSRKPRADPASPSPLAIAPLSLCSSSLSSAGGLRRWPPHISSRR